MELPLREQGTLLTGVRGCDLTPKLPLDSTERRLVSYLRWTFMVPFAQAEVDLAPGCFFQTLSPMKFEWCASELGHYPQHWYSHLMHCYEVVGYRHPDRGIGGTCFWTYTTLVDSLHLTIETFEQMVTRLAEDRSTPEKVIS
jgi:hypothetical protein